MLHEGPSGCGIQSQLYQFILPIYTRWIPFLLHPPLTLLSCAQHKILPSWYRALWWQQIPQPTPWVIWPPVGRDTAPMAQHSNCWGNDLSSGYFLLLPAPARPINYPQTSNFYHHFPPFQTACLPPQEFSCRVFTFPQFSSRGTLTLILILLALIKT